MPVVTIEAPSAKPLTVAAPEGGALADLCDDLAAAVPFSCRSASCGTCRIVILEGEDELLPAEDEELDVLDVFQHAAPRYRLACCAKMRPGEGRLRLRPVRDDE
jgi:2Fe-2S ferredoxin